MESNERTPLFVGSSSIPDEPEPEPAHASPSHERSSSYVPDFVLTSIENMGDVFHDVQEHFEDVAHDLVTFETLDPEQLVEQAEEEGIIPHLDDMDSKEAEEVIEEFIHPVDPMDPLASVETLGVLPLAVIVFYNVSGGPFGIETSVRAGGNFFALLGFLVMPFIWVVQEALMTAELGTAFPEASGGVAWVEEAFGARAGFISGYLGWIAGATDNAIYPVLFLDYVLSATHRDITDINPVVRFCFLSSASMLLGYVNWRGLPLVGKMSTWICLVAMSPFIFLVVLGARQVEPHRWFLLPNDAEVHDASAVTDDDVSGGFFPDAALWGVLWRPFLNNLFWNLNSFDAAGSFAGEIDNPGRMFPKAMFWGVILVCVGYFLPLLIAVGAADVQRTEWTDGFLAQVTGQVVGPWLGAWTVFAAGISNIALFQAELSADAFQLMGMADRGHLPKIFSRRSRHGTPTNGIIVGVAVIVVMGVSDFDQLIEMLNFNYAIALLMEYAAFIKLRIAEPHIERPFRIPLNTFGCILLFIPPVVATLLLMALATYTTYAFVIGVNIVGVLILYGKSISDRQNEGEIECAAEKVGDGSVGTSPNSVDTNE